MARRRISGVKLADLIRRSQPYVSRRLTGDVAFDLDDLEAIAKALQCRISDLLPPEEATQPSVRVTQPLLCKTDPVRSGDQPNTRPRVAHPRDTRPTGRTQPDAIRRPQRRPALLPAAVMTLPETR